MSCQVYFVVVKVEVGEECVVVEEMLQYDVVVFGLFWGDVVECVVEVFWYCVFDVGQGLVVFGIGCVVGYLVELFWIVVQGVCQCVWFEVIEGVYCCYEVVEVMVVEVGVLEFFYGVFFFCGLLV